MIAPTEFTTELKPIQIETIRALLTERTVQGAARKVGVCRQTIWRWTKQREFKEVLVAGRRIQLEELLADLQSRLG